MTDERKRFHDFVERKTAAASAACLHVFETDFDRAGGTLAGIGNEWSRHLFGGDFYVSPLPVATHPACGLVFVQSRDGNTGAENPRTLGGGDTDKHLIYEGLSQVAADAVLSGAGTIRGGDIVFGVWHPELVSLRAALGKPRYPIQIVASLHGLQFGEHLLFNVPEVQVIVLTVARGARRMLDGGASRPWVRVLEMAAPDALPDALRTLRALGIERVSAVGGRHVATQLIDAGLVQDVYLTTSPQPGGEPGTPMYPRALSARALVRKHGTGPERGVIFDHLELMPSAVTSAAVEPAPG